MTRMTQTPDKKKQRKRIAMAGAAICFGLVIGLILAEITLRAIGVSADPVRTRRYLHRIAEPYDYFHCYTSNPNGEFKPVPKVWPGPWALYRVKQTFEPIGLDLIQQTPWCVPYNFSPQLLRDRFYPPQPESGVLRICGMGDSFTYGEGVTIDKTLYKQLERLLGNHVEIVSAGEPGIDTNKELELIQQWAPALNCARTILTFIPNDISLSKELHSRQKFINDLINIRDYKLEADRDKRWYLGRSRLVDVVDNYFAMKRYTNETIQWYRDMYDPAFNAEGLATLRLRFEELAAMKDRPAVVVIYPLMEGFESGYPLADVHEQVAAMVREAGLPVLDLAPVFSGQKTTSFQVHPSDHHPNGRAHALAAEAIARWLRDDESWFLKLPDASTTPQ